MSTMEIRLLLLRDLFSHNVMMLFKVTLSHNATFQKAAIMSNSSRHPVIINKLCPNDNSQVYKEAKSGKINSGFIIF